jgi:hypothetical protein
MDLLAVAAGKRVEPVRFEKGQPGYCLIHLGIVWHWHTAVVEVVGDLPVAVALQPDLSEKCAEAGRLRRDEIRPSEGEARIPDFLTSPQ